MNYLIKDLSENRIGSLESYGTLIERIGKIGNEGTLVDVMYKTKSGLDNLFNLFDRARSSLAESSFIANYNFEDWADNFTLSSWNYSKMRKSSYYKYTSFYAIYLTH